MDERRKNQRLPIEMPVRVYLSGKGATLRGETRNVSFGGVAVSLAAGHGLSPEEHAVVAIALQETAPRLEVRAWCRVAHASGTGAGLQFLQMAVEDFQHLRQMLIMNSPEPDAVIEELRTAPGLTVVSALDEDVIPE